MSIDGSLAVMGVVLLALGVAASTRWISAPTRSSSSPSGAPAGAEAGRAQDSAQNSGLGWIAVALLVAGAVVLVAAGVVMIAVWIAFSRYF